jgi:hypothetical protein
VHATPSDYSISESIAVLLLATSRAAATSDNVHIETLVLVNDKMKPHGDGRQRTAGSFKIIIIIIIISHGARAGRQAQRRCMAAYYYMEFQTPGVLNTLTQSRRFETSLKLCCKRV